MASRVPFLTSPRHRRETVEPRSPGAATRCAGIGQGIRADGRSGAALAEHCPWLTKQPEQIYYAANLDTGKLLAERFVEEYTPSYPQMVKCFCEDLDACLVHLKYPLAHRKYIRTTNLLERAFVEEKRRTKVMPQHVNERGAVKLVYAVLVRASRRWQQVRMPPLELAQLRSIRRLMRPKDSDEETISFRPAV